MTKATMISRALMVLCGVTALHVAYRVGSAQRPTGPNSVSNLKVGSEIPEVSAFTIKEAGVASPDAKQAVADVSSNDTRIVESNNSKAAATTPITKEGGGTQLAVAAQSANLRRNDCHVLVVFSPTCPHCHEAAKRAAALHSKDRVPTTWISVANDTGAQRFASIVPQEDRVVYSADVGKAMQINAVPALFVIDATNRLRRTEAYSGLEPDSSLRRACAE